MSQFIPKMKVAFIYCQKRQIISKAIRVKLISGHYCGQMDWDGKITFE